jgi:hypothetical protein
MRFLLKVIGIFIVCIFAGIGLTVTVVYFGMQQGMLNVRGSIMERNASFGPVPTIENATSSEAAGNGCKEGLSQTEPCEWDETIQWEVVKGGLQKDAEIINRVAKETGVSPRMIAAAVIPEQTRFFSDNREVFKRYFEPLKLLASLSQFSLGVSGIKQATAVKIEEYSRDSTSPFYPGDGIADLLAYPAEDVDNQNALFNRLTDEKDHYYSYLYTALYLKQITAQWEKAGYDVAKRPDVLVTLFNLGFGASAPKPDPQVGGAAITIGSQTYSFGYLGTLFYESDELRTEFPEQF